jgi:putative transposase
MTAQQQALRDFDQAMRDWWAGSHHRPGWRKTGVDDGSSVRDVVIKRLNRRWATLQVPELGPVRFQPSPPTPSDHALGRVTCDRSGRWHVSFTAPQPVLEATPKRRSVGLDAGAVATLTTSHLETFHAPGLRPGEARRLRRLQRNLARQEQGSKRPAATKIAIAELKAEEAERWNDFVEQTTTVLVRDFDLIAVEDLSVTRTVRSAKATVGEPGVNVAAKRGPNQAISAQGWSMLRRRLTDKAATCDVTVVAVKPAHTSPRRAVRGHTRTENRKSRAVFVRRACEQAANADMNAADNILAAGEAVTARGGTSPNDGPGEARTQPVAA